MKETSINKAADILWTTRLAQGRLAALPADCRPAAGYAVQAAMAALAGQARRVGDSVARVRELESIRSFLTGNALTLVIDLVFTGVFLKPAAPCWRGV